MWVINQDCLAVVDVQALALDPSEISRFGEDDKHKTIRVWGSISDHDYVMGVYGSVDEAIDVMCKFAQHAQNNPNEPFKMPASTILNNKKVA